MGSVDVTRAFHTMTLPPPESGVHEWPPAIPFEEGDRVGIPIVGDYEPYECSDLELLSDEEQDAQIREAVSHIASILRAGPQPLHLVLDMLECGFDLEPQCAQALFWQALRRGHVSLRAGSVHLGQFEPAHTHR
jgi:hypothetical protein